MKLFFQIKKLSEPCPRLPSRQTGVGVDLLGNAFFYFAILFFIIGFGFRDVPPTPFGWYQQFMPSMGTEQIADITFLDSLTGFAITQTHYILKTINGGDNWYIIYNDTIGSIFSKIKFLNNNIGFVGGSIINNSLYYILKTTNSGLNWFYINAPFQSTYQDDMSVLNEDTIWTVMSESLTGGVFRTTNGGASWVQQISLGSLNPDHIYFYNWNLGFITRSDLSNTYIRRTTDGGQTWTVIESGGGTWFTEMNFIDSLTGWMNAPSSTGGNMWRTTNGGLNWADSEILPSGGYISSGSAIQSFSNIGRDTMWGAGGYIYYPTQRTFLYKTTNNGSTWYMQIPDTSFEIANLSYLQFVNRLNGWSYNGTRGIHTVTGGDTTFLTGIKQIGLKVPDNFILFQNYPNPFNPVTIIKYELPKGARVTLNIYDILGRELLTLVNDEFRTAGYYEAKFDGSNFASGIYFYKIQAGDFVQTKKMVLIK